MVLNDTDFLYREYSNDIKSVLLPSSIWLCTVLCVGIIGNFTVLFIYCTRVMGKLTEPRYFIPVLAFYDLLACISSMAFVIKDIFIWTSTCSDTILCKIVILVFENSAGSSTAFLVVIAVQRYIKICRPYSKQMTLFWRRIALTSVIIANVIYLIPAGIFSGIEDYEFVYKNTSLSIKMCVEVRENSGVLGIGYHVLMTVVLALYVVLAAGFYLPVGYTICRHRTQQKYMINRKENNIPPKMKVSTLSGNEPSSKVVVSRKYEKAKSNFTRMFLTIITVYLVSYVPTCGVAVYASIDTSFWISRSFSDLAVWFLLGHSYVINHAVNPVIYVYFDATMRRKVVALFRKSSGTHVVN